MSIKDFTFDFAAQKNLALGEYKVDTNDDAQSKAQGMCGTGYQCTGGGQCGYGIRCAGG